jgi:hypothetical protein
MTRQWLRSFGLTIDTGSETIDVSNLRGRFRIRLAVVQSPNSAEIIVTNLSEATAQKIRKEGQKVSLTIGYQSGPSIAFTGNIIQKRVGRENPVDTYLAIVAQDGDIAYNFATVSKTLSAGSTFKDQVDVVLEAMKPHGVTKGYISDLGGRKMPRARTLFGMARDAMRDIAISAGANWTIQDGKLDVVKFGETKPGDVIVLNSQTGMIGRPVQTFDGVIARMLINPRVKPNAKIKIDEASIDAAAFTPDYRAAVGNSNLATGIATDGLYKIVTVEHHGDTHGNPWYTEIIAHRADDQGIYFNIASQNIVAQEVDGSSAAP